MDVVVTRLTVHFASRRVRALDGLDLRVASGEQVALLGESGAGKTTLLRSLLGAVRPLAGSVRLDGLDPHGGADERRHVRRAAALIRQSGDLVPTLSGRVNALLGTSPTWRARDWARIISGRVPPAHAARLAALAARHEIADCLDTPVRDLSGGQRQRIALLRALLPGPRLLLADEPTAGLDPRTATAAVDDLRGVQGVTLIVSTHDLAVARRFPRVVALRAGRVVYDGGDFGEDLAADVYGMTRTAVADGVCE